MCPVMANYWMQRVHPSQIRPRDNKDQSVWGLWAARDATELLMLATFDDLYSITG